MRLQKAAIIGMGHVGAHIMYALAVQGLVDEIVLVDSNEQKAVSECQDLFDTVPMLPRRVRVRTGSYEDAAACDVIFHSAGKITLLIGNEDRTSELRFTIPTVHTWVDRVREAGFKGFVINITNPCDVVTREIALNLGLPEGHVFGTGTGLDTNRLIARLSEATEMDAQSITAFMLGEHGNSQFAPWSCVSFRGMPLSVLAEQDERFRFDHDELEHKAIRGGWYTFAGKHCTEYAIATTAVRMAQAIQYDEKLIMPASTLLKGEYGEKDIFVGVPAVIGANGVEKVMELPLTDEEKAKFHSCCDSIRKNMALADSLEK